MSFKFDRSSLCFPCLHFSVAPLTPDFYHLMFIPVRLLSLLLLFWVCWTGTSQAGALAERVAVFPEWESKPVVKSAAGDLVYDRTVSASFSGSAPTLLKPGRNHNCLPVPTLQNSVNYGRPDYGNLLISPGAAIFQGEPFSGGARDRPVALYRYRLELSPN